MSWTEGLHQVARNSTIFCTGPCSSSGHSIFSSSWPISKKHRSTCLFKKIDAGYPENTMQLQVDAIRSRNALSLPKALLQWVKVCLKKWQPKVIQRFAFMCVCLLVRQRAKPLTNYASLNVTASMNEGLEKTYTRHLWHQTPFTPKGFCTKDLLTPDTFYKKHLLPETPFSPDNF